MTPLSDCSQHAQVLPCGELPDHQSMAVLHCTYASPAIGCQTGCTIILPDDVSDAPMPVVYQLHGLSDNHTTWQRAHLN